MRCPFCKHDDDKVIDSRSTNDGASIRRRRECIPCGKRFTTYERSEEQPLAVVKKDGNRQPFDRAKIMDGLQKACQKRPIAVARLEDIVDRIELELYEKFEREVPAKEIGELVMSELRNLDQVAYVRFASVYREFKDASDFVDALQPFDAATGKPRR
ncbi:MAG: transcriptional repressor NrdR [Candidatus Brocadiae bacterium]|nr:transcriptional repressor NrdR [Candidatus Brocadiia bacterium]